MSYLALARKWRPRIFAELIGQDHVSHILINSLNQQRLHHAYLFTGTRGVGKTSVARLLAKALNCEQGISANPCLQCAACIAIEQGCFIDLIEVDGASRTRVEDTKDLLENIHYSPTSGRFKIYLIDEVHMLSQHSFNALLKTLEEPPAHVKFLFATTDPQKLPLTILSRCLQFNLHHLLPQHINQHLQYIMTQEQQNITPESLILIANAAKGSMRDALSLLDQVIVSTNTQISVDIVKKILNYPQQNFSEQLLHALIENNALQLINISRQIAHENGNFDYVLDELINYLHQITLYQILSTPTQQNTTELFNQDLFLHTLEIIIACAQQMTPDFVQLLYQIAIKGSKDMHLAPTLVIGFEMTLLRMFAFAPQITKSIQHAKPVQSTIINESWEQILQQLKLTGVAKNAIEQAKFIHLNNKELKLEVPKGYQSLFTTTIIKKIEQTLSVYYKKSMTLQLLFTANKIHVTHSTAPHLTNDNVLEEIKEKFSAEIVKNSIYEK